VEVLIGSSLFEAGRWKQTGSVASGAVPDPVPEWPFAGWAGQRARPGSGAPEWPMERPWRRAVAAM